MSAPPLPITAALADTDEAVAAALAHCRRLTRARGRNFYYGLKLTPEPKRSAMYAIYAFMRACDDLVDQPPAPRSPAGGVRVSAASLDDLISRVEQFRARLRDCLSGNDEIPTAPPTERPMWSAFRWVMRQYPIDPTNLHAMLDGQGQDLTQRRYVGFAELHGYCHKVASTVGLVCIDIWGHDGQPETRRMAEDRGIALQLTNILRDLVEDARRDRVYLPIDELARFGYSPEQFLAAVTGSAAVDQRFDHLMAFQIERAQGYYARSADLESHVDPACRATCWAMMRIYRSLLDKIVADPRRVLTSRVRLSSWRKLGIALTAARRRNCD